MVGLVRSEPILNIKKDSRQTYVTNLDQVTKYPTLENLKRANVS